MRKEIALIFNPAAGGGTAYKKKERVEAYLESLDLYYDLYETTSEAHLVQVADEVVQHYPIIIGAGGDTTLSIIAQKIIRSGKGNTLGVISLGSVNDLGREIGVYKLEAACRAIKEGRTMALDVGVLKIGKQSEPYFFLGQASLGLGVAVNRYVEIWLEKHNFISRFYTLAQAIAAISGFFYSYKQKIVPLNIEVMMREARIPVFTPLIIITNTSVNARSFHISPFANPIDGKLDCCILHASTLPRFINALIQVKRQTHLKNKKMEIFQANDFKIRCLQPIDIQADGKIFRSKGDIEISTLPQAIKIIINPNFRFWMS